MIYHSIAHVVTEKSADGTFYFDARVYELKEYPLDDLPKDCKLVWRGIYLAVQLHPEPKKDL